MLGSEAELELGFIFGCDSQSNAKPRGTLACHPREPSPSGRPSGREPSRGGEPGGSWKENRTRQRVRRKIAASAPSVCANWQGPGLTGFRVSVRRVAGWGLIPGLGSTRFQPGGARLGIPYTLYVYATPWGLHLGGQFLAFEIPTQRSSPTRVQMSRMPRRSRSTQETTSVQSP